MKKLLLAIFLLGAFSFAQADTFVAGTDYTVINAKAPNQKVVQVVEFFNYGCPWCAHAEPSVEAWLKNMPKNVNFTRIPLTFEQGWDTYAKAYYLAVALGIEPKITPALFVAIHGSDDMQDNDLSSMAGITAFFVGQGVQASVVQNAFNSPSMDTKLQQGPAMMTQYGVWAIPTFVVAGKYSVVLSQAKNPDRMMQIVNYLITQSQAQ